MMDKKVLLLGEFSAFHKNLAEGLLDIGVNVVTASNGDGWKKIASDINWGSSRNNYRGKVETLYNLAHVYKKFENFDAVQLISPLVFPRQFGINKAFIKNIRKNNEKLFLLGAGGTTENTYIADFFKNRYKYPQLYREIIKRIGSEWSLSDAGINYNKYLLSIIDGYIPIMYEYAQGYRDVNYPFLKPTIPIPINLDKIEYRENRVISKINFYHGVTRGGEKGTPLIREAMERLKKNYPNDVNINIVGNLPLNEYIEVTKRANVIIDQVYSASYGMNTVYNLALGKVCIGGGEAEALKEFKLDKSPLIPIDATVDDIYGKMINILECKNDILDIGYDSREYAEKTHSHKLIAKKYLDVWSGI